KNDKRVSSASEDSLNDFKTPPSTRASKSLDVKHSGFDSDNSPAVRSINSIFKLHLKTSIVKKVQSNLTKVIFNKANCYLIIIYKSRQSHSD
ncbi:GSCOCG00009324001-RA-CDS, partial [Cotesia congregata]